MIRTKRTMPVIDRTRNSTISEYPISWLSEDNVVFTFSRKIAIDAASRPPAI